MLLSRGASSSYVVIDAAILRAGSGRDHKQADGNYPSIAHPDPPLLSD
jgi:hypothetical protein